MPYSDIGRPVRSAIAMLRFEICPRPSWSANFWRDKHWLGNEVLQHMRASFNSSPFQRVYFVETMDGQGMFEANLTINEIKA